MSNFALYSLKFVVVGHLYDLFAIKHTDGNFIVEIAGQEYALRGLSRFLLTESFTRNEAKAVLGKNVENGQLLIRRKAA